MTYVWKPREDGINFRESAHENNVCGKSATGDYTCTRPKGHAGWHVASGIDGAYEVWPDGVFVPVPDGVAYDDALRAVNDARPWVPLPDPADVMGLPDGTRIRMEWPKGEPSRTSTYVHPDDVPDPDADLIERIAAALCDAEDDPDRYHSWVASEGDDAARDAYRQQARAALAVVREDGAR